MRRLTFRLYADEQSALDQSNFPAASFLGSLIGAAHLLVIVNWVRRAAVP